LLKKWAFLMAVLSVLVIGAGSCVAAVQVAADIDGRVLVRHYTQGTQPGALYSSSGVFTVAPLVNNGTYSLYLQQAIPNAELVFNVDPQVGLLNIEGRNVTVQNVQNSAIASISGKVIVVKITQDMNFLNDSYGRPTVVLAAGSWFKVTLK
jgi:hypothetical protein